MSGYIFSAVQHDSVQVSANYSINLQLPPFQWIKYFMSAVPTGGGIINPRVFLQSQFGAVTLAEFTVWLDSGNLGCKLIWQNLAPSYIINVQIANAGNPVIVTDIVQAWG